MGPGERLSCDEEDWVYGSGLAWSLPTMGQGFREPQKFANLSQSQHSPSQLGGARVEVGTEEQINGKDVVRPRRRKCNWRLASQTLGTSEVEIPCRGLDGMVPAKPPGAAQLCQTASVSTSQVEEPPGV